MCVCVCVCVCVRVILAECPTDCSTEKRLLADSGSLTIFSCLTSFENSLCTKERKGITKKIFNKFYQVLYAVFV